MKRVCYVVHSVWDAADGIELLQFTNYPQSETLNRQCAMNAKTKWVILGITNETLDRPRRTFPDVSVERSQNRILVRLRRIGAMAVQWFFRNRAMCWWSSEMASAAPRVKQTRLSLPANSFPERLQDLRCERAGRTIGMLALWESPSSMVICTFEERGCHSDR